MSSVDERVVKMNFDNAEFERGVKTSLSSLDALNKGLKLEGATKGLTDVSAAASKLSLANISDGVSSIADKFKALSVIGITALSNLTMKAISAGSQIVSSLTIDPIKAGLSEYETNLNSIQTILSNTQWQHTGLAEVNDALNQLNQYSDLTIYNFSQMARNIGTFTAAGVGLQTSVDAIKGIANLAAISGSSSDQASTAMYQLSQALATGTVKLMDWNSVVNAGMGGKVFQDALMETARVHGVAVDQIVKEEGSFRDSLQKGWLTSQILTETLQKFTGDLTASQLKTMGYNDQQIAGILKMGQTAKDAATKIKTFSQLLNTLQESAGSGWAQTWQLIFGDFEEAKTLFTNVYNVLGGFISASAKARNSVLADWKELGGRTAFINAISNAFTALIDVLRPIKDAFREIFPPITGKQLADFSKLLESFTEKLKIGATTADELKRTFAGVFAILGIGWDIVKAGAKFLADLFGMATKGSGGFLEVTAKIGDFLVALKTAIEQGRGLELFFGTLEKILSGPLSLIGLLAKAVGNLFDKFDAQKAAKDVTGIVATLEPITNIGDLIVSIWSKIGKILETSWDIFAPIAQKIGAFFSGLGKWIMEGFQGINYDDVLGTINTGLLAGLLLLVKKFYDKLKNRGDIGSGFLDTIKDSFGQLTDTLSAMQNTLKAATLLEIAAAIGIMTISVAALSHIDSEGLTRALTAMGVMFTELLSSMAVFQNFIGTKGFLKMPFVMTSLILLAAAIDILTVAIKNLSMLSWEGLLKGLSGLAVILGVLVTTVQLMPNDAKMIGTSIGLIALAAAIKILVSAVTDMSGLSWSEMAKGLTGVGTLLIALGLYTKFAEANKAGVLSGVGLVLLAASIKIMASALSDLGQLSWGEIGKGLTAMLGSLTIMVAALDFIPPSAILGAAGVLIVALSLGKVADALDQMGAMSWGEIGKSLAAMLGALTIITAALYLIPPTAPLSAAGVLLVAISLNQIAAVLEQFSQFSWSEIGKSLAELAGALGIITIALMLTVGALPGAAAIIIVAASLAILAPVLQMFSQMSWEEMGKGLLMLAGVFVVLGTAGLLLTPLVPTLIGLGIAVTLLGAGMLLAGAGVLAFSIGLTALSVAGTAGAAAIVGIVSALIGLIPQVMTEIGLGVVAFAQVIATAGPAITGAITTVLLALITAIITLTPKIVEALYTLMQTLLQTMANHTPQMVQAGFRIIIGVLQGIANNIGGVVDAATNVIVNFINAISANLGRVIDSGVKMIISFVNGLANAIRNNSSAMRQAGLNLAMAIIDGMTGGLASGVGRVIQAAKNVAKSALDAALGLLGIHSPSTEFMAIGRYSDEGLAKGLDKYSTVVSSSATTVGQNALDAMRKSISGMSNIVSGEIGNIQPIITPVLDLSDIKENAGQINKVLSGSVQIYTDVSRNQANNASAGYGDNPSNPNGSDSSGGNTFAYTQNNYSPKALSSAEIYRQTNNQLSKVKEVIKPK